MPAVVLHIIEQRLRLVGIPVFRKAQKLIGTFQNTS